MVEKAIDIKAKIGLQPPFGIKKIDFRYPKKYKPLVKNDKNNTYQEQRNEVINKNKAKTQFHNPFSSINQSQT